MKEYIFTPNFKHREKERQEKKLENLKISIVGSPENSNEENNAEFGKYIAERISKFAEKTEKEGKKLIFDAATGGTPKPVWPQVEKLIKAGKINLDNFVVMGHEEVWRNNEEETDTKIPKSYVVNATGDNRKKNFDTFRKEEIFNRNSHAVKAISSTDDVSGESIEGNFLPMRQDSSPEKSMKKYGEIINALQKRDDVYFLGLYGIGTDAHIGEIQIQSMGIKDTLKRRGAYIDNVENYGPTAGGFLWQKNEDEFHPENNFYWMRNKSGKEENIGRTKFDKVGGIGWKDMLKEDYVILAFDKASKSLAFESAMEGSINGDIVGEGKNISVDRNKGKGEDIFDELKEYALSLAKKQIINKRTVKEIEEAGGLKCGKLFKVIYEALNLEKTPSSADSYQRLWKLINGYVGKRSPLSRLIRMRTLLGRQTEIVATPEVVENTKFKKLLNNGE